MKILAITNLYPPQELGGYGRSIADFVWGLTEEGHTVQVISTNAPYLGENTKEGPSGEAVNRELKLKGSYERGIKHMQNQKERELVDQENKALLAKWINSNQWDGILLGNIDLIGPEIIKTLLTAKCNIQHHIGFVHAPYNINEFPQSEKYMIVAASKAVKKALCNSGLPVMNSRVIFPGVRSQLFVKGKGIIPRPLKPIGNKNRPLKICYAGLLMSSKGVHTIIEAIIILKKMQIHTQTNIAGSGFQDGYKEQLVKELKQAGIEGDVKFYGQLNRSELARFYSLNHIGIFSSIHPEAFGIVAAEMMASGLVVISTGVGGAKEVVKNEETGLLFKAGNALDLANKIKLLLDNNNTMETIQKRAYEYAHNELNVKTSAKLLEDGFNQTTKGEMVFR